MEVNQRNKSLQESAKQINLQQISIVTLCLAVLLLALIVFNQNKIVIQQTPGMPADTIIQKTSLDKGAQRAVVIAVTSNLAQINPENVQYQKTFLQAFLSPQEYTRISAEVDERVKRLVDQRELGSYYFVLKSAEYDPKLDRHFVIGDVHTVNAAKDTGAPWVFEYAMHVENYRSVIDSVKLYEGSIAQNSAWKESQKR